ncbi:MAG TPA: NlpC/P60 family protein [Acetivibrio sp.]|nr:NlpC/P60 family protein [Acetivibrio sp.]
MIKKITAMLITAVMSICFLVTPAFADYYSDKKTLYRGMSSSNVTELQKDLRDLGYFRQNPTGYFGSITYQSVINYQRDNNLAVDGIVGRQTARELKVDKVLQTAKSYQGVPYVWGGTSPSGFDCSGFTHYVMLKNGIIIQRTASAQYNEGSPVSKSNLKPGDLVFFSTYKKGPSHVGIYVGNNKFIHASSGAGKVVISDLNTSYYVQHYIGARRIIN